MSQRIMYSILPHLAEPGQVASTEGVVDYSALKAAVAGRKNLIKYGVRAIIDELRHANDAEKSKSLAQKFTEMGKYELAMDIAVDSFGNDNMWLAGFGGRAWEQIAKTLRQIIRLDQTLSTIQSNPIKHQADEVQIMRDLIVQMNVFDGLSHNSAEVMNNLVGNETPPNYKGGRGDDFKKNHNHLRRLMDSKELESPAEVFKMIEPTLKGSGDNIRFKDWISRMHRSPDYRRRDTATAKKLYLIHMRKFFTPARGRMNDQRDRIQSRLAQLSPYEEAAQVKNLFAATIDEMEIISAELREATQEFFERYPDFDDQKPEIIQLDNHFAEQARSIYKTTKTKFQAAGQASSYGKAVALYKEILTLINKFSYLLDSI